MDSGQFFPADLYRGKNVFITGGGSGINLGIAKGFAAHGANIAICGRTQAKLDAAAKELEGLGTRVSARAADVRKPEELNAALAACRDTLGPVDILVCGAAGNFLVPAEKLSPNGFKTVIDIDLLGSFNASRLAFDQLAQTRGSIVFISAGMAHMPYAYQLHVGAAKAGIDRMMQNLALEWGPHGIRVNSIVPGPIAGTEGMKRLGGADHQQRGRAGVPLGRMGTVEDIAHAALFLCSPVADWITGVVLTVDGGSGLAGSGNFNTNAARLLAEQQGASS
ncbi:MAG TPA: SDR family oxidoreductase [Stellaceae bacterium]|jgi:NAD(P)-dependent dehydrogenase (short-subunit alcohol dehydrogenase family)|nr:SDR family oxidoreductase [Stellaceae bacterium]